MARKKKNKSNLGILFKFGIFGAIAYILLNTDVYFELMGNVIDGFIDPQTKALSDIGILSNGLIFGLIIALVAFILIYDDSK